MAEGWNSYLCKVNDKLASIRVDLALREHAPDASCPYLLFIFVYFKTQRPDGLSSQEEFATLCSIEDALTSAIIKECGGRMAGCITTDGRREFYFYAPHALHFQDALDKGLLEYGNYRYRSGHKKDPDWSQYLQVLFPTPLQRQEIENRKVLDALESRGDSLLVERDVMHWAYFESPGDRESFKRAALRLEYSIEEESISEGERSYSLRFKKKQAVPPDEIDRSVLELFQLAESFNGEYDGWETEIISDNSGLVQ